MGHIEAEPAGIAQFSLCPFWIVWKLSTLKRQVFAGSPHLMSDTFSDQSYNHDEKVTLWPDLTFTIFISLYSKAKQS